jgi:hypothetical protein
MEKIFVENYNNIWNLIVSKYKIQLHRIDSRVDKKIHNVLIDSGFPFHKVVLLSLSDLYKEVYKYGISTR